MGCIDTPPHVRTAEQVRLVDNSLDSRAKGRDEMARYHIGRDGEPHVCKAQEGQCPLGGEHFDDLRKCEKVCEERFAVRQGPFSKRKNMEKIKNLPDQVYLSNYYRTYARRASREAGSPMVIKRAGQVYAVTEKDLKTGKETFVEPRQILDFENESKEYRMVPLDECKRRRRELDNDRVWYPINGYNRYTSNDLDKTEDPVELESGGLKNALKAVDRKIDNLGSGMDMGVGSYMRDQTRKAVNDPNNPFGQAIRRMNDRM